MKRFASILLVFIIICSSISLGSYYYRFEQEDWRSVASYITQNKEEGDIILIAPPNTGEFVMRYYCHQPGDIQTIPPTGGYLSGEYDNRVKITEDNINSIAEIAEGHARFWLVTNRLSSSGDIVFSYLDDNADRFSLTESRQFSGGYINIYLYDIKSQ